MAHKKIIDSVKKQGQVTIKDLDEFLRFVINEYDMRTLNNNYISILISMQLDVNKVFGLDVCKRSDDDYVILYSCWYLNKDVFGRQFEMRLYHYDNSNDDDDLGLDIVMTQSQYDAVLQRFEEQYKRLTELPLKGAGKTLFLTAAKTRRKKFEYQPLRTLQGALLAENHKQATETQYHRNRSLQRDAGHTSHHHEKK